jgi:hypothetical protein
MKQKATQNERHKGRKTQSADKYKGLERRLSELDHEECARIAREQIREANEEGSEDRILCPCWVRSNFGMKEKDLYALAENEILSVIDDDETGLPHFSATELCTFFERSAAVKARKEREKNASETKGEQSGSTITKNAA